MEAASFTQPFQRLDRPRERPVAGNSWWTCRRTGLDPAGGGSDDKGQAGQGDARKQLWRTAFGANGITGGDSWASSAPMPTGSDTDRRSGAIRRITIPSPTKRPRNSDRRALTCGVIGNRHGYRSHHSPIATAASALSARCRSLRTSFNQRRWSILHS